MIKICQLLAHLCVSEIRGEQGRGPHGEGPHLPGRQRRRAKGTWKLNKK